MERLSLEKAGRGDRASFGLGERQAPKVLGDVMESLIGATYLDTQGSFDETWRIWEPLIQPLHTPETVPMHPVRELLELCQGLHWDLQFLRVHNSDHCDSDKDGARAGSGALNVKESEIMDLDDDSGSEDKEDDEEEEYLELEAAVHDAAPEDACTIKDRSNCSREDSLASGARAAVEFHKDRPGRHAVSELRAEPVSVKVVVQAIVQGTVAAEGQGTHIRAARREAARNALEGRLAQYRRDRRDRR